MSIDTSKVEEKGGFSRSEYTGMEAVRQLDPALRGGFKLIFDREVPIEIRIQEGDKAPHEVGTLEAIRAKVLVSDKDAVRVELTAESDLFFHYTHTCIQKEFGAIREEQRLMVDFTDYPQVLARSFTQAIREPHNYLAVFVMDQEGIARLDFIQNMEYKFVELLSVDFVKTAENFIKQHIVYRYNALKARLALAEEHIHDIHLQIRSKNPALSETLPKYPALQTSMQDHSNRTNEMLASPTWSNSQPNRDSLHGFTEPPPAISRRGDRRTRGIPGAGLPPAHGYLGIRPSSSQQTRAKGF